MRRILVPLILGACASPVPAPSVTVEPLEPDTRDDLVARVTHEAGLGVGYAWYVDEERVPEVSGPRVPASLTARGETWRVEVTATDGAERSTASATTLIRNAPPSLSAEIGPPAPEAGDALVVAAVAVDADGDETTVRYAWSRDGKRMPEYVEGYVPQGITRRGERWAVAVQASDGFASGPETLLEVDVANAAPEVLDAWIDPATPSTTDALHARVQVQDADGDPIVLSYTWTVGEQVVQQGSQARLPADATDRGDVIRVTITASDGSRAGEGWTTEAVVVRNSPPGRPGVRIVPDEPTAGEALRCEVDATPLDPDGDAIAAYGISWTVDDVPFTDTTTSRLTGDTVPAGITQGDEVWRCTIRASDGDLWGPGRSLATSVAWDGFAPSQTVAGRTLTCTSVVHDGTWTQCNGLRVEGQAFPNGLSCGLGWSSQASPHTDHADLCAMITGSRTFQADYQCDVNTERVTWDGSAWGSRDDNGYTRALRCGW